MLYNKNQFRKTNDKKVLHKIGKHWVTISVTFLSLLGLGAVSTTTKADTTMANKTPQTSAAPVHQGSDTINKQVTSQASALHNQLLGQAAVNQSASNISQGDNHSGQLNSVNERNHTNPSADKATNHSILNKTARLGASNNLTDAPNTIYGTIDGMNYSYNYHEASLEITGGQANRRFNHFYSDLMSYASNNASDGNPYSKLSDNGATSIKFDPGINTSNVTNMSSTFNGVNATKITGLNNLDTSNVTNMSSMFQSASDLTSVQGISDWNTQNVTNLSHMFEYDSHLNGNAVDTAINNGWSFKDPNVRTRGMAHGTSINKGKKPSLVKYNNNLYILNLPDHKPLQRQTMYHYDGLNYHFDPDTNTVEFVNGQLTKAKGWSDVNQSNYAAHLSNSFSAKAPENIKNASHIIFDRDATISPKVTNVTGMFFGMPNLQSINFGVAFNNNKFNNISYMFSTDPKLRTIKLPQGFNTNYVTNMSFMFAHDKRLSNIDLGSDANSQFGVRTGYDNPHHYGVDMNGVFYLTPSLTSMSDIEGFNHFDTSYAMYMNWMFSQTGMSQIDLSQDPKFNTQHVTTMNYMFEGNNKLSNSDGYGDVIPAINFGKHFDTSHVTSMQSMFADNGYNDSDFNYLHLPDSFDTSNVTNMNSMFANDGRLAFSNEKGTHFELPKLFNTAKVTNMNDMFKGLDSARSDASSNDASDNFVNMILPKSFIINSGINTHGMFSNADLHSLKIQSSNTAFNSNNELLSSYTGLLNLYQYLSKAQYGESSDDNNGNYYTLSTPNDFSKGLLGTFGPKEPLPQQIGFSDIYGDIDGHKDRMLPKEPRSKETAPTGWAFVNSDGQTVPSDDPQFKNGRAMVAPVYDGMTYKYNQKSNTVEFTEGFPKSLKNFDNSNVKAPYDSDVKKATSMTFDSDVDTQGVKNMSNAFANKNLKDLTLGKHFDTSDVTNMSGMFKDAPLNDLKIKAPDSKLANNKLTNIPNLYRTVSTPQGQKQLTESNPAQFSKNSRQSPVGEYISSRNPIRVSDYINYNTVDKDGQIVNLKHVPLGTQDAGTLYRVTSDMLPAGYQFAKSDKLTHGKDIFNLGDNNHTYIVTVSPMMGSAYVNYKYGNQQVASDNNFTGNYDGDRKYFNNTGTSITSDNDYGLNRTDSDKPQQSGWHLAKATNPITFNNLDNDDQVKTQNVPVLPDQVSDSVIYEDVSDGNKPVGNTIVKGNYYKDTVAGNYQTIFTPNYTPGLAKGYSLNDSSDVIAHNGHSFEIPVHRNHGADALHYRYNNTPVSSATVSFAGTPTGTFNASTSEPAGWHIASGTTSQYSYDNQEHDISIAPNTITENINYQVQNNSAYATKDSVFSGFSSNVNDSRAIQANNTSFEVNSESDANLPQGYHIIKSVTISGKTDVTSSASTTDVEIAPDKEAMNVNFETPNGDFVGSAINTDGTTFSGYVGNPAPHMTVLNGYHLIKGESLPTSFGVSSDEYGSDYGNDNISLTVVPDQKTDSITYINNLNNQKVGSTSLTGNSLLVPNASDKITHITPSYTPNLPEGYKLVNSDNPIPFDGLPHNVYVDPTTNTDTIHYYDDNTVNGNSELGSYNIHGNHSGQFKVNHNYAPGLPTGYHLANSDNYNQQNIFSYSDQSDDVAVIPDLAYDSINFQYNGQTKGTTTVLGNSVAAKNAKGTNTIITNTTPGVPTGYHLDEPVKVSFDGQTHNVAIEPNSDLDTVDYQYKGNTIGKYQLTTKQGSDIDVTPTNQPNMPEGYHLVNNINKFKANDSTHYVPVVPDDTGFTITFKNGDQVIGHHGYNGMVNNEFTINGTTDVPVNYTINPHQTLQYTFNADPAKNHAVIQITPQPATENVNFVYENNDHQQFNEGGVKLNAGHYGDLGTLKNSDYSSIKPGWQVIPGQQQSNNFKYSDGNFNIYVEPKQITDTIWYLDNTTGQLISNDGPFSDTISMTGNDIQASDASSNSFIIGVHPRGLNTGYFKVDNPTQVINFDGQKHIVNVTPIKQTPASAAASQASAKANAAAANSYNKVVNSIASQTNSSVANSYKNSITSSVANSIASSTASSVDSSSNSVASSYESSADSQIASSYSSSVSQSSSSTTNSLDSSIASSYASSIAAKSVISSQTSNSIPYVPMSMTSVQSSYASSTSQRSSESASSTEPVTLTNLGYPIRYGNAKIPDKVTYMGREYAVHYHANGKNTIQAKSNKYYKTVTVSTNLPIVKPSSDSLVRSVDRINFDGPVKHILTRRGLDRVLNNIKPAQVVSYHGTKMAVVNMRTHWRYFMVTKDALAHNFILDVGAENTKNVLHAHHEYTIFIKRIVAVHSPQANHVRYEFSTDHHNFWVTARNDYVPNSYYQASDFDAANTSYVRVIRPCRLYTRSKYNDRTLIRNVPKGVIAHVAKVIYINHPSYEQTRLVLDNGTYITANKNYVKLVNGPHGPRRSHSRILKRNHDVSKRQDHARDVAKHYVNGLSDATVKAVNRINWNAPVKRVLTKRGLAKVLNRAEPGQVISYHGTKMAVLNARTHWRYFMVTKDALAHDFILDVGAINTVNVLRKHHEYTIFIKRIVAVHHAGRNYVRYEFSVNHRNFWVTARNDYVPNSYYQASDFAARRSRTVRVIRPCRLYIRPKYSYRTLIRNVPKGIVAHVKRVIYINHPSYEQTRLVLNNGRYITANKNYVRIIK